MATQQPCDSCGSSDAKVIYDDGHSYCFSCNTHKQNDSDGGNLVQPNDIKRADKLNNPNYIAPSIKVVSSDDRGITKQTFERYGVKTGQLANGGSAIVAHYYPYYNEEGSHVATKARNTVDKSFHIRGSGKSMCLFGQQLFPKGGKTITICEGELDAMSSYQMHGSKYPCVSVPNGAAAAVRDCRNNYEYLQSFEKIYIDFDNDEHGNKAANAVASLFKPNQVQIVKKDLYKDANDYLKNGKKDEYVRAWWNAEVWTPDGIVGAGSLKDYLKNHKVPLSMALPFNKLQEMTGGLRLSELVVVTAETSVGKTAILREIVYNLITKNPDVKIGAMFNEETYRDSAMGLLSLHMNKRLDLSETEYTEEEFDNAFDELLGTADDTPVYFYDHFGSDNMNAVLNKVRYFAKGLGCSYFILDHISMLVTGSETDNERKELDNIINALKKLAMELNIGIVVVAHKNRGGQIRGTAGIEQVANIVVSLERDLRNPDERVRNTTFVTVWKNRFSGKTGPAGYLYFNHNTGRLEELEEDPAVMAQVETEFNDTPWEVE